MVADEGEHQDPPVDGRLVGAGLLEGLLLELGGTALLGALARHRINVTVSRAAWTRLDMEARHLPAVIRASVHYYNTEDEVDRFCTTLAAIG